MASSSRWLARQHRDPYVARSKAEGYRSRAAYKLLAFQEKLNLIRPGQTVVDLGAAPGSWSQVAQRAVGRKGQVIALDLLPIDPISGVDVIQGDFTQQTVYEDLLAVIEAKKTQKIPVVDWVISDLAPNMSGILVSDQARSMLLVELALEFAQTVLKPGGCFLTKVFQGVGIEDFFSGVKQSFVKMKTVKPNASRSESREIYVLAQDFRSY